MLPKSQKLKQVTLWPSLPYNNWKDTLDTVHMWMQIVGKVKLKLCPFINHWWNVVLYVTPHGLTTGRIPYENEAFAVDFDFINHAAAIRTSEGEEKAIALTPRSVAEFYKEFMADLHALDIKISINPVPAEFLNPIPFEEDTKHASYNKDYVEKWWHIQLRSSFIFDRFRTPFRGKSSPVQFFWGSFDLNETRFSGKKLPDKTDWPKGYSFMRYAETEENFDCGFWPGDERFPHPAFYSYMYPAPKGHETINTGSTLAYFNKELSQCILPYEDLRKTKYPEKEITNFLETTYQENAKLAGWDIQSLEGPVPEK